MSIQISFKKTQLDLQCLTKILAISVVEDVSMCMDILTLKFLSNFGASSIFTRVYADTTPAAGPSQSRSLAMTSILLLLPSFVTQASLVLWRLQRLQSRLLQCHLGPQLDLENSEMMDLTPHF